MKKIILFLFTASLSLTLSAQEDTASTKERKIFIYSPQREDAIFTKIKLDINGKHVNMPLNSIAEFSLTGKEIMIKVVNETAGVRNGETVKVLAKDANYFIAKKVINAEFKESFEVEELCGSCYDEVSGRIKRKVAVE